MKHIELIKIVIATFLAITLFIVLNATVAFTDAYNSINMLLAGFGLPITDNPLVLVFIFALVSIVFFVNILQLLRNKIDIRLIKVDVVIYVILFIAITMLKSRGIQELNFDISDIFKQLVEYPISVVMNILLFVPLGAIFFKFIKPVSLAFISAFAIVAAIEILQFFLHLGITDVVDVVINMVGFTIGYLVCDVARSFGVRFTIDNSRYINLRTG